MTIAEDTLTKPGDLLQASGSKGEEGEVYAHIPVAFPATPQLVAKAKRELKKALILKYGSLGSIEYRHGKECYCNYRTSVVRHFHILAVGTLPKEA